MTKQLKYSIFCNRKRFNIISWLKVSSEKTYPAFCIFLKSRNVLPPDEDYFNRALAHFNLTLPVSVEPNPVETQPMIEEKLPVVQDLAQEVKQNKESDEPEVKTEAVTQPAEEISPEASPVESELKLDDEPLKEVKKTTRRKRRRKSADVSHEN